VTSKVSVEFDTFSETVTQVVANEGLRHSLVSGVSLVFRLCSEHLVLAHFLNTETTPGSLAKLTDNSPETIRLYLREAEKAGLIEVTNKPNHSVFPTPLLINLVIEAVNRGIMKALPFELKQCLLARTKTEQKQFSMLALKIIHQWAEETQALRNYRNVFRSSVKRSIFCGLAMLEPETSIAAKSVRQNYNISHESFRTFKNELAEQNLIDINKESGSVYLKPTY